MKRSQFPIVFFFAIFLFQPHVWAQENDILDFRVISDSPRELVIEVAYVYSGNMGKKIGMSAGVSGEHDYKIGAVPAWVYPGRHAARIHLSAIEERASRPFTTGELKLYMYEQSSGRRVSRPKMFPYQKIWLSDASAPPKNNLPEQKRGSRSSIQLAYQVQGHGNEAGGSFKAMIQFISKYQAKLQMNHFFQTDEWIDMRVETISNRNILMFAMLPSGNSMKWDVVFSNDMNSLRGNVIMYASDDSNFAVTGVRVK